MLGVPVFRAAVRNTSDVGQRGTQRFLDDTWHPPLKQLDADLRNLFDRHNGDACIQIIAAKHLVHVAIYVQESVATAEQLRPFQPEITGRCQFDLAGMLRFVASEGHGVPDLGMLAATNQSQTNHESCSAGETSAGA